jgi:threonine/homoserine/homoserine lactone efflux protein
VEQVFFAADVWRPAAALVLAATVVMGSPGPATMSVTAVGAAFGWRRSLPYVGGVMLGTAAVLVVVALGLVAMLLAVPGLAPVLVAVSAVYILYLAYKIATAPPLPSQCMAAAPTFAGGLLLGVANPKAYVAIAAVFAGARLPLPSPATEALAKTAILAAMIVVIHLAWLAAGAALARLMRDPVAARAVNAVFAASLVAATALALLG